MPQDFLKNIADTILLDYRDKLDKLQVVFPNRRAGQFLLQHLAAASQQPIWAPQVLSMSQFLEQFSDLKRADNLLLSFKLYPIYQQLMPGEETFDQFYSWAEIILKDFDNLDQQCIQADKLFYLLQDMKEIDGENLLSDEQKAALKNFYGGFEKGSDTSSGHKEKFMAFWTALPELYKLFKEQLLAEGIAYSGMIARQVVEEVNYADLLEDKLVLFCGFNALTKAEERAIKTLIKKDKARLFWDVDQHLLKPEQEAGLYLRKWQKDEVFKATFPTDIPNNLARKLQESIQLIELPLEHVQAREVCRQLEQQLKANGVPGDQELTRTAIVLPDESQLFPLLYQLPDALENSTVNVTMGVPLRITPVYSLLDNLLELQSTCERGENNFFHYKPVTNLLRHPYVRGLDPTLIYAKLHDIERYNRNYIAASEFEGTALETIFSCASDGTGRANYLLQILEKVNGQLRKQNSSQLTLEEEYISRTRTHLESMLEIAAETRIQVSTELLEKLMRQLLQQLRIPFVGEPLQGLQVMGMLETRCLDFDSLYVLSLNEGVLPAASDEPSLIPYFIRSAYGLPTTDEHDAVYAYHFYRLLQRAKNIRLFYSTYRAGGKQGELSRFVRQLTYELWPAVKPQQLYLNARPAVSPALNLSKEEVKSAFLKYVDNGEPAKELSPSALNTWLHCKTQFAFRYLLGIKEADEVQEDVDSSVFGTLMHKVLQTFYEEFDLGIEVTKGDIIQKINKKSLVDRVKSAYTKEDEAVLSLGRNSLPLHMVAKMVEQVLEVDKAYAPFKIVSLEKTYSMPITVPCGNTNYTMRLKGNIDRIDEKNGELRVLDYKTGKDTRAFKTIPGLFVRDDKDRNKAAMQVLIYSLLYGNQTDVQVDKKVLPALYNSKELYSKDFDGKLKIGDDTLHALTDVHKQEVEEQLQLLLQDVMSGEGMLDQRADEEGCKYCGYSSICGRL